MQCDPPPPPAVTHDTATDDKPKRPWSRPQVRRMKVNFTESGPTVESTALEDVNYTPGS